MRLRGLVVVAVLVAGACGTAAEEPAATVTTTGPTSTTIAQPTTTTTTTTATTTTATTTTTTSQPPASTTTTTTAPLQIWEQVYAAVQEISRERPQPGQEMVFLRSPGVSDETVTGSIRNYTAAAAFWSGAFDFDESVLVHTVDERDHDWWAEKAEALQGHRFDPDLFDNVIDATTVYGSVTRGVDEIPHIFDYVGTRADTKSIFGAGVRWWITVHETTHWFQAMALRPAGDECLLDANTCPSNDMPCWSREGHANLYAIPLALIDSTAETAAFHRQNLLDLILNSFPDVGSFDQYDWLGFLGLPWGDARCGGATGVRVAYQLGLATNEILFHDFGDQAITDWWLLVTSFPNSPECPSWHPAFEATFGVTAESWYVSSAVPYLLDTFADPSTRAETESLVGIPEAKYCKAADPDGPSWPAAPIPTASVGGADPRYSCSSFQTQEEAQVWLGYNPDRGENVDTNGDGTACGFDDRGGLVECNGVTDAPVLARFCPGSEGGGGAEHTGPAPHHGCGAFESQQAAQEWFDANPELGENADTNGDGTACGEGDDGGITDCNGSAEPPVLAWQCPQSSAGGEGSQGQSTGPEPHHGCGAFESQQAAQEWFDANPELGENADTNGDGTACGEGDDGGLTDCGGWVDPPVLAWRCPQNEPA